MNAGNDVKCRTKLYMYIWNHGEIICVTSFYKSSSNHYFIENRAHYTMAWSRVAQTRRYKKHSRTVIHTSRLAMCKGPHTCSNKFAQQHVVQETVHTRYDKFT